jgi:hypothetical protein
MRLRIALGLCFMLATPAFGQEDLGQLMQRVSSLWEARSRMTKTAALKFVEPQTQDIFLQLTEAPILSFKVAGIEFTEDPNQVHVNVRVRGVVARVGEMDRIVRDTWVWKDGQWLMRAAPPPTMFDSDIEKRPPAPVRPNFQVAETVVDIGRHAQGDVIEGKIAFKATRNEIVVIRPVDRVPGLALGSPTWTDASSGYLTYRWETALLSESVNKSIALEAIGTSDGRTSVQLQFRARIDGKVAFKQVPEIVEPTTDGQFELQIQNLTKQPLKILSVMSNNPAYVVDDNVPPSIEPGKSGRLLIRHSKQNRGTGASIGLVLSEPLTPSGIVTVPINVRMPDVERPPSYTPETLKPFVQPPPAGFK